MLTRYRQRAIKIDPALQKSRLESFLEPVKIAWQDEQFRQGSSSFQGFCEMLGLETVGQYMQTKQAQKMPDWTEIELDHQGKLVQEEMTRKFQVRISHMRLSETI